MKQEDIIDNPVVQRYLHELVGTEGMQVALSPSEGEVTDEEIAEDIGVDVNAVRRVLIILSENNLADYRRVRDEDSGWLTYYWTYQYQRIPSQLEDYMVRLYEELKKREEYEMNNQFYVCPMCRRQYSFEDSVELQFNCPQCRSSLESVDSERILKLLKRRKKKLKRELQID